MKSAGDRPPREIVKRCFRLGGTLFYGDTKAPGRLGTPTPPDGARARGARVDPAPERTRTRSEAALGGNKYMGRRTIAQAALTEDTTVETICDDTRYV